MGTIILKKRPNSIEINGAQQGSRKILSDQYEIDSFNCQSDL